MNAYFKSSLSVSLLAGCTLFVISLIIQSEIFQTFMQVAFLSLPLAIAFEASKVCSIILCQYLAYIAVGRKTRTLAVFFRVGLLSLSIICSGLYMANHLDRPHLEVVKQADIALAETSRQEKIELSRKKIGDLKERHNTQKQEALAFYNRQVGELESLLREEMNNVVGSTFIGQRYKEFQRRLNEAKAEKQRVLNKLITRQTQEYQTLQVAVSDELAAIESDFQSQRQAIIDNNYAEDERVNDPLIVALLALTRAVFDFDIKPLEFVFVFALLISVLMELGIIITFESVTLMMLPVLKQAHQNTVEEERLKSKLDSDLRQENMKSEHTVDKLNGIMNILQNKKAVHS